ncbi:unnamed protein product [Linum trigynum]|uniref:Endonuclease/exonuclease/phosphatase domain-containing protein n=1 Tax=Linum trigynum TaxID=586398 RepID=A0AAV2CII4_9ROSI
MTQSILIWNVRGLGSCDNRAKIKGLLRRWKPDIVVLTETKWRSYSQRLISSVSGSRFSDWDAKNVVEAKGGIAIYWDRRVFKREIEWEGKFTLEVKLCEISTGKDISLLVVYGPQKKEDKLEFISELRMVCRYYSDPLCIIGYFNLVQGNDDYRGQPRDIEVITKFNEFISDCDLLDLPLSGSLFTWSNGSGSFSKIDRAIINSSFDSSFSPDSIMALDRVESDHCAIFLKWGALDRIRRPWRFENMWILDESYSTRLVGWWNVPVNGHGVLFLFGQRLKQAKALIKCWNRDHFGRVEQRIKDLLRKIKFFDQMEEQGVIPEDARVEKNMLKCELEKLLLMEEIAWRQKSRELWLSIGDKNTGFFHRMASNNRRKNKIHFVKINGERVSDPNGIKNAFVDHFVARFADNHTNNPFPKSFKPDVFSLDENYSLAKPFTEVEIWQAIKNCDGDKAPGPDAFTLAFYKSGWHVIKNDLLKALDEFYFLGSLPKSVGHSFICLLPKKDAAEEVKISDRLA